MSHKIFFYIFFCVVNTCGYDAQKYFYTISIKFSFSVHTIFKHAIISKRFLFGGLLDTPILYAPLYYNANHEWQ